MEKLVVKGGQKTTGEIEVHGAKNSSLPLLAATILSDNQTVLKNCPKLSDVDAACEILSYIGCSIHREDGVVIVDTDGIKEYEVPEKLMRQMRSSIVFLGAIISRLGKAKISFPGGCELGPRPIDLHLFGLRKLGVHIEESGGYLNCYLKNKHLKGAKISLSFPSVGATENIILAAVKAKGRTTILNAAQEPEIIDLADYLNRCGAKIYGAGENTIIIDGVDKMIGVEYSVMPDRIVASTYMCCPAITGGELLLKNVNLCDLDSIVPILEEAGCYIRVYGRNIYIRGNNKVNSIKCVRTMPYPGFPTDAQSTLLALMTIADGTSMFIENIFENRFKVASELVRMGANIRIEGKVALVKGVDKLHGTSLECSDLRGGAALIIAALAAEGESNIYNIEHIDRGYEKIENNLKKIGLCIKRE